MSLDLKPKKWAGAIRMVTVGAGTRALTVGGANAIGVNNRDLRTFEVNLETSLALAERIPASLVRVSESGIFTAADIARLRNAGFDAFLIGESLMRKPDPGAALAELLAEVATKAPKK